MAHSSPRPDFPADDGLDYFRKLQEKYEQRESGRTWHHRGNLAVTLLVVLAGSFTLWLRYDSFGHRPLSFSLAALLSVTFSGTLMWGLILVPVARTRKAFPRVAVDGNDLSVTQPANYSMFVLFAMMAWPMSAVFVWMTGDSDALFPGGAATHYAGSAFLAIMPLIFLAIAAGGSELTVRGHTLTYRAGAWSSGTIELTPYVRTKVISTRGVDNLTISVYPSVRTKTIAIPRTSRHVSIPGLAVPHLSLHSVATLIDCRSATGTASVDLEHKDPFPRFQPRSLLIALGVVTLVIAATVQVGWTTAVPAAFVGLSLSLPVTSVIPRASILRPEATENGDRLSVTCGYGGLVLAPAYLFLAIAAVVCARRALAANDFWTFLVYGALSIGTCALLVNWSVRSFGATRISADSERLIVDMGALFHAEVAFSDIRTVEREVTLWPRLKVFTDGHVSATILGFETTRRSIVIAAPFLHGVHVDNLASSLMRRKVVQKSSQSTPPTPQAPLSR